MKKALVIVLMCLYTIGVTGVSISFHYCGNTLKHFGLLPDKDDKGCCGTKKKDKCCKDKIVKIEKQEHQKTISKALYHNPEINKAFQTYTGLSVKNQSYPEAVFYHLRPPPLEKNSPPLYILHATFRV